jgi:hypothetical protein
VTAAARLANRLRFATRTSRLAAYRSRRRSDLDVVEQLLLREVNSKPNMPLPAASAISEM